MGNQQAATKQSTVKHHVTVKDKSKEKHTKTIDGDKIKCSCGYVLKTEHQYNLHIECHCTDLKPIDPSGWPERHFDTVPYVKNTQRCVVSKGNIGYAAFSFVTLADDFDEQIVRKAIASVPSLAKKLGETENANERGANVSALIGINANLWKEWDPTPPHGLKDFRTKFNAGDPAQALFPRRPGKYQLFVLTKANRVDLCYELQSRIRAQFEGKKGGVVSFETTQGFAYMASPPYGGKDLTGFVDGTRNPDHLLRSVVDEVVIFPDDDANAKHHVGGTYMFAGRFVHNLEKFFAMPLDQKNNVIGRDYSKVRVHHGYDKRPENPRLGKAGEDEYDSMEGVPKRSHTARAFGSMQRIAYPFIEKEERGLMFTAYARYLTEIDTALDRMAGVYSKDKSTDLLLDITKAMECMYYYVPSLVELERVDPTSENAYVRTKMEITEEREEQEEGDEKEKAKAEGEEEEEEDDGSDEKKIKVLFEYCTNCGYKTAFVEKKKVMEALSDAIEVVPNPTIPRLAAFEITLEDGTVIWSKLSFKDGRNNYPHVFPQNSQLIEKLKPVLEAANAKINKQSKDNLGKIYDDGHTNIGIW